MIDKCRNNRIRTRSCVNCSLCGASGELVYQDLEDRLYGVPGKWNLKKCPNPRCGLIWLDPIPFEEDISEAYVEYYTHQDIKKNYNKLLTQLYCFVKEGYWAKKYGYFSSSAKWWKRILGNLIYLHPPKRAMNDIGVMCLPAKECGYLLDVGCGSGEWLRRMQGMGWRVEGIDFDRLAVDKAKNKGLSVHFGSLDAQRYPDNYFDAITMKHVIEHLHSPLQLLRECHRILKPGGRIVIETPNSQSLGHSIFSRNWRGLEPPRHLQIMNRAILKKIITEARFEITSIRTIVNSYMVNQSYALFRHATLHNGEIQLARLESCAAKIITIIESFLLLLNNNIGEAIIVMAEKKIM